MLARCGELPHLFCGNSHSNRVVLPWVGANRFRPTAGRVCLHLVGKAHLPRIRSMVNSARAQSIENKQILTLACDHNHHTRPLLLLHLTPLPPHAAIARCRSPPPQSAATACRFRTPLPHVVAVCRNRTPLPHAATAHRYHTPLQSAATAVLCHCSCSL